MSQEEAFFDWLSEDDLKTQEEHPCSSRKRARGECASIVNHYFRQIKDGFRKINEREMARRKEKSPPRSPKKRKEVPVMRVQVHGRKPTIPITKTLGRSSNYASFSTEGSKKSEITPKNPFVENPEDEKEEDDLVLSVMDTIKQATQNLSVGGVCHLFLSILPLAATVPVAAKIGAAATMNPLFMAPVAMAFCPNPMMLMENIESFGEQLLPESWEMESHQRGLLLITVAQGSLGICRMFLGDVFGGAYALMLATLGFNSRFPGPAVNWLKTYILITFINGTVGTVDLIQNLLLGNYPVISPSLPLQLNIAHLIQFSVPMISFSGSLIGWAFISAQKSYMAKYNYEQSKPPPLNPHLPWPPPALPAPEVMEHMTHKMLDFQHRLTAMASVECEFIHSLKGVPGSGLQQELNELAISNKSLCESIQKIGDLTQNLTKANPAIVFDPELAQAQVDKAMIASKERKRQREIEQAALKNAGGDGCCGGGPCGSPTPCGPPSTKCATPCGKDACKTDDWQKDGPKKLGQPKKGIAMKKGISAGTPKNSVPNTATKADKSKGIKLTRSNASSRASSVDSNASTASQKSQVPKKGISISKKSTDKKSCCEGTPKSTAAPCC